MSTEAFTRTAVPPWTIADRLRKARESADMDQADLADEMGVARSTVSNYERGVRDPRRIVLQAWARCTAVPYEWLIGEDEL